MPKLTVFAAAADTRHCEHATHSEPGGFALQQTLPGGGSDVSNNVVTMTGPDEDAGIIVRRVTGYGFPEGLRITVGDAAACARVATVVREFMRVKA